MVIRQGDICWVDFGPPRGSGPAFRRPCVVVQNNLFNQSRIHTVIVCPITSSLRRAASPGNVRLPKGEAGVPKPSVINVSQIFTVGKSDLHKKIGSLSPSRFQSVLDGISLVLSPRDLTFNRD